MTAVDPYVWGLEKGENMSVEAKTNVRPWRWLKEREFLSGEASNKVVLFALISLSFLFVWLSVKIPIELRSVQALDDGLYLDQAMAIVDGGWLSEYSSRLLGKPPGFALFLAASHLSGLPFTLTVAIFQMMAAGVFAYGLYRVTSQWWLAVAAYATIIFSPNYFFLRQVLREAIYPSEIFMWLGLLLIASVSKFRIPLFFSAGVWFGFAWVTREDGIWMLPALPFFLVCFWSGARQTLMAGLVFAFGFAAVHTTVSAANYSHYGIWATAEISDRDFVAAMSSLQSVETGGQKSGVAVTVATRQEIYKVSPAFASLRPFLEAPGNLQTCDWYPETCGEIRNGWFHWAARQAAAAAGHSKDAISSSAFYRSLAQEVTQACQTGALQCAYRPIAQLPIIHRSDIAGIAGYFVKLWGKLLNVDMGKDYQHVSSGSDEAIARYAAFLNWPRLFPATDASQVGTMPIRIYDHIYSWFPSGTLLLLTATFALAAVGMLRKTRTIFARMWLFNLAILVLVVSRVGLLAIIGETSFGTANVTYLSVAVPLANVAILLLFANALTFATGRTLQR